ncbi:precorrin-2 C(20)-methyltransferase [Lichenicola sp.]|uniref:precorrin-2 C(20)-methyltransferase n=1 Tax=Lichenicola sp. TaxID=2804529 RepID=UPI003AFFFD2B
MMRALGTLHTIGMGPGDPELLTLKALRLIGQAPVVAYFAKRGRVGHARSIAGARLHPDAIELRFEYPFTTELSIEDPRYPVDMGVFYEACAGRIAAHLDGGQDVALLCEGDPFFYGSSMYLYDRLHADYPHETVPGVTGMSGCWTAAGLPIAHGDDMLCVLPGTLDEDRLVDRLLGCDAAVIMKVGRNLAKIQRALRRAGMAERAVYVERGTQDGQCILPMTGMDGRAAPYFSMVLVQGRQRLR